jgi:F-type H+-transporting ATPase subunit b
MHAAVQRVSLAALLLAPASLARAASENVGMPQLDPSGFVPQLVWLAIVFTVLYLVLSRVVLPRIGEVLEDRQARIADDLDAAEKLKADAEKARGDYEAALAKARAAAQEASTKAREQVAAESTSRRAKVDHELAEKTRAAEAAISAAKAKALADIRASAAEVAATAVQRITGQPVSPESIAAAVAAAAKGG